MQSLSADPDQSQRIYLRLADYSMKESRETSKASGMLRSSPRSVINKTLTMASHLKIGVFGGGVVGGGVYELVQKCNSSGRFQSIGASMEISKICVRDLNKQRDFALASGTTLVTDYNEILNDPSINCVVELMGGITR